MAYRCTTCGREWEADAAQENEYLCTRKCGGDLVAVEAPGYELLPSVVAIPLAEYHAEAHPVMRLHRLCDAVEIIVRFLTVTALGEVRRRQGPDALPAALLGVLRERIERPTLGQWRDMLAALIGELEGAGQPALPELWTVAGERLLPLLQGGGASAEESLLALRNDLVHGGGMTGAQARGLLEGWSPRFEALIEHLGPLQSCDLCVCLESGVRRLRGASAETEPYAADPSLREALTGRTGRVVLLQGSACLELWPLCEYGRAAAVTPEGRRESPADSPLVYFRAERDRLLYAALGVDLPRAESRDVVEEFRSLFRLDAERVSSAGVSDFDAEIRADGQSLIGRQAEIAQGRAAIGATAEGVLWITGPGGIGKSLVLARLASNALNAPRHACCVVWRFKTGDAARCSRIAFLRHAATRVSAWLGRDLGPPPEEPERLEDRLHTLLRGFAELPPTDPRGRAPRALFFLDGLDEIARFDADFVEAPFRLSGSNVVWVCAGRSEGRLPEVFSPDRCVHVFPGGLPPMDSRDVRGMLLEETGSRKYELVARDRETVTGDGQAAVLNGAIDAIVARAAGLPLYVHFVIQDLLTNAFRMADLEAHLPPSLADYYERLLQSAGVGELHALLTPVVVTVANAPAPLDEDTLHWLMVRRGALLDESPASRSTLRRCLQAAQALVRSVPALGARVGFEPYHPTFREHVLADATGVIGDQNPMAQRGLCELAQSWGDLPRDSAARHYAVRFGPTILTAAERWADLAALLSDLDYLTIAWHDQRKYELMAHWRRLEGRFAPEPCYEAAAQECERQNGPTVETAARLRTAGLFLMYLGLFEAAERLQRRGLAIEEETLGEEAPEVAASLHNLAEACREQARYEEALALGERALAIFEAHAPPTSTIVAVTLSGLAGLYAQLARFDEARQALQRALVLREFARGPESREVALNLGALGALYCELGCYAEALPLLERALAIDEQALGPEHPDVAADLANLADVHRQRGSLGAARPLYERALTIREATYGPHHPEVAKILNNLGLFLWQAKEPEEALPLLRRALAAEEQTVGPTHPNTAQVLNNLALACRDTGSLEEALRLLERALEVREACFAANHPAVAQTQNNIGMVYVRMGRLDEALHLYERALAGREKAYGVSHPHVALSLYNLGEVYRLRGHTSAALLLYRQALSIQERLLQPTHPDLADTLLGMAAALRAEGNPTVALPLIERAVALRETVVGLRHPLTEAAQADRAACWAELRNSP